MDGVTSAEREGEEEEEKESEKKRERIERIRFVTIMGAMDR